MARIKQPRRDNRLDWTEEMRLGLHLMYTEFDFGHDRAARDYVFKTVFEKDTVGKTLGPGTLSVQYGEHAYPNKQRLWNQVLNPATSEAEKRRRSDLKAEIASAVERLAKERRGGIESSQTQRPANTPTHASAPVHSPIPTHTAFSPQALAHTPKRRVSAVLLATPSRVSKPTTSSKAFKATSRTPRTPTASGGSRRSNATILLERINGDIYITDEEYAELQNVRENGHKSIPDKVAHPPVSLLFRYWDEKSRSKPTKKGFVAGDFSTTDIRPPPPPRLGTKSDSMYFPWAKTGTHFERDEVASPWISTSQSLAWILRLACKEESRGASGYITVIDPGQMDRRGIYHAQPIHKELCREFPFSKGAFRYAGSNELLCWAGIPDSACLTTVSVEDLRKLTREDADISNLLRLKQLATLSSNSAAKSAFAAHNPNLDARTISTIARIVKFFNIGPMAPIEHLGAVTQDLIQFFTKHRKYKSPEEWIQAAEDFCSEMEAGHRSTIREHMKLKMAFLDSSKWAMADHNARHLTKPENLRLMLGRARKAGLESPAAIISNELDAIKLHLTAYERAPLRRLHNSAPSQRLLADADPDGDEIMVGTTSSENGEEGYDIEDWLI